MEIFNKNKKTTALPDVRVGSFDMEVFIEGDSSIIYALGFYSYLDGEPKMYYINKELDSYKNVITCLNEMFTTNYKGITWYCHNSGRYDSRILLKILYEYNSIIKERNKRILIYNNSVKQYNKLVVEHNNILEGCSFNYDNTDDYNKKITKYNIHKIYDDKAFNMILEKKLDESQLFDIKTTFRKSTILKLQISKTVDKTKHTITICDSCAIFPDSLSNLAKKYKISTLKGDFPHGFVNNKTIFYIGNTPDYSYFENTDIKDYNEVYSTN